MDPMKSPKLPDRPFGLPSDNLLVSLANSKGWFDETLALIGMPRLRLAKMRGVSAATLQNYSDRRARMPADLALWLWEERQWRAAHPVPKPTGNSTNATRTSATVYDARPMSKSKAARAAWDKLAATGPLETLRLVRGQWVGTRPNGKTDTLAGA
jgi:hypothetical protein